MFSRPVSTATGDDVDWFQILTAPSEKKEPLYCSPSSIYADVAPGLSPV